jgi:hypothetical protein
LDAGAASGFHSETPLEALRFADESARSAEADGSFGSFDKHAWRCEQQELWMQFPQVSNGPDDWQLPGVPPVASQT